METSVTNNQKKQFLKWITSNYEMKRRESLWILDYLYNHDIMLEKTHFVEQVDQTPRGIYMSVKGMQEPAFRFYKNGHTFKDAMQAFHEIRLNWSSRLFIEVDFGDTWQSPEYLAVLEDNPHAKWNDLIPDELISEMDEALTFETLYIAREKLLEAIDHSLSLGSEEDFTKLTSELRKLDREIEENALQE